MTIFRSGMKAASLSFASARDIASAVQSRSISATETVGACLGEIERLDGRLHAFQVKRREKALAEAAEVDRRRDLAELPLAGVAVAIKDNFDVAGEPTRHGSRATSDAPAQSDDECVRRLRAAGAVVVGKTTMPELAIFGFTESAFGVARNPWNEQRSPGGSSGGSAVAVATRMAHVGLSTDGLGSTRIPANFCGILGLKPTRGRLPLMRGIAEHWYGMSVSGCMARTVGDVALMLDVLAGGREHSEVKPPDRPLRIALSTRPATFLAQLDPVVEKAVRATAKVLGDAGHTVVEADPPYPVTLANNVLRNWAAGVAQDAARLQQRDLEPRTRTMARIGRRLGPAPAKAMADWRSKATAWFERFDIAVMPTVAKPSIPAGVWMGRGLVSTMLSQIRAYPYAAPWNFAGFPGLAVPAGFAPDGVPTSVQLVAPAGGDELLLSVAAQLENLQPWPSFGGASGTAH